jgi:DNA-binding transcriptional ArsR family regulator
LPARHNVRSKADVAETAAVFAALGDETRLGLVSILCDAGPTSIAKLTESFDMTRQAITKHLRVMQEAGLVRRTQQGRESIWRLEPKRLADARQHLESVSAQWEGALTRLRRFLEG